jgi:hypothetical protein
VQRWQTRRGSPGKTPIVAAVETTPQGQPIRLDLGKRWFHLYGIDTDGVILSQKVSRAKLAEVVGNLAPTAIAMEACASAHPLGSMLARCRPRSASHQSSFRQALRQGIEERCGRRGGDLRSSDASNDALRAGEVETSRTCNRFIAPATG